MNDNAKLKIKSISVEGAVKPDYDESYYHL